MKKLFFLFLLMFCTTVYGAPPSRLHTYTAGTTILSSHVTNNENAIFNYLQAGVDTYGDNTIVNADINESAAIANSKLNLTVITQNITHSGTLTQGGTASFTTISNLGAVTTTGAVTTGGKVTAAANEIEGSNFDIDGGTIDGVTIGASSAPTVTNIDINGGTVDGITSFTVANNVDIGSYDLRAATLTADGLTSGGILIASTNGLLTTDTDLTFSTDTLTATKIGAFTSTGAINFDSQNMTNVDIDSGTIDGVTVTALTAGGNLDIGSYELRAQTFQSDVTTGTAPLIVASTTKVTNLNTDTLDGYNTSTTAAATTIPVTDASGYLPDASVDTAALKTTSGEVSTASTSFVNLTLPGGAYGFYPQVKVSAQNGQATIGQVNFANTAYVTNIALLNTVGGANTTSAQQTYVTASGTDYWIFFLIDKITGEIISAYSAPDHPMYGNGGDLEAVPHPFINNDLTGKEVVLLSKEDVELLKTQKTKKKTMLDIVFEKYKKVDVEMEETYEPLHTGEFVDEKPVRIEKLPTGIKVRKLKK